MRHYFYLLSVMFLLVGFAAPAQLLPIYQPEQDACNALLLCGNSFYTPYSYQGNGLQSDLAHTPCDIPGLNAGEDNPMWIRLEVATSGTILFTLTPVNSQDDYDWAVLNITNGNCNNLSPSQVVRCNFNRNVPVYNNGVTGLNMISTETGVAANTQGHNYCKYIDAQAGEVYLIMINNFGFQGGISSGFTIDFSASTATFNNAAPPHLDSITNPCQTSQFALVKLTKPILCSSIATNGSDFSLTGGGSISSTSGINCSGSQGYTNEIKVLFTGNLPAGQYVLHAETGTDNNTLLDLCNNALPLPDSIPFIVPRLSDTDNVTICEQQLPYNWHGQIIQQGGQGVAQAHFTTSRGCDSILSLNLMVVDTITTVQTIMICPGQLPYSWNGISVNAGGNHVANYLTQSQAGCDSLTFLNLLIQYPETKTYHLEGCGSVSFNNRTYNQTQTASDTIISNIGCDSIYATLNIIVHPVDTISYTLDTAGCGSVFFNGKAYDTSTTLRDTLRNQYGCDSVYHINHIIVYPNKYTPYTNYISKCDSVIFEGKTYYYDITLNDTFQNILGCDSAVRITNIHPIHFQISLSAAPDSPVVGVYIHLKTQANLPNYQVLAWMPLADFPLQTATEQIIKAENPDWFTFQAVGQSEEGCLDTAILQIHVDTLVPNVFMPSAFSPNGDGLNDIFEPRFVNKSGFEIETFKIFNRYGQLVYRSDRSTHAGWNGTYANGQKAENGVYYYEIQIRFVDGTAINKKGDVTLIR